MNPLFAGLPTTIFEEISTLARQYDALNLGQGVPDGNGPEDVRAHAAEALMHGSNQYPPMLGMPELRRAVVEHYNRVQGLDLCVDEVLVTFGATEALACALFALIAPGDEVVLIQPMYDVYLPIVRQAAGVAKFVRLEPPHWRLDEAALEAAISPATRVLVLNNPLNPAARMFDSEELAAVARVCVRHDLIAVCDEVWEHITFDDRRHLPLMAFQGMRERTIKIGSAGKIFSMTGWKVGFACAAPALQHVLAKTHQVLAFTVPPNLQAGVAYGLAKTESYFAAARGGFQRSRDRLAGALSAQGYAVLPSQGAYFLCVDLQASGVEVDDQAFCRAAIIQAGVAAIPVSAFYTEAPVRNVARLCFAKQDATLDEAARRLGAARRLFTAAG